MCRTPTTRRGRVFTFGKRIPQVSKDVYKRQGILMDKATGEKLLVGDAPVEGEVQFTPDTSNGAETVP